MVTRKGLKELYDLILIWLKIRIRSPISNWLSKAAFIVGAMVVSTPLIEHLIFTAILKKLLDIDLGISVPDVGAYVAGCFLMASAMIHNLIFVKLNQQHTENQRNIKTSIYQELWGLIDDMVDSTVRLTHLYCTEYKESDDSYASTSETAIMKVLDHSRKNRPFYFSEELYENVSELSVTCMSQARSFRACINMKKKDMHDYDFYLAQKSINGEYPELKAKYDGICHEIRSYVSAI